MLGHIGEDAVVLLHVLHKGIELLLDGCVVDVWTGRCTLFHVLALGIIAVDIGVHVECVGTLCLHLNFIILQKS